VSSGCVEAAADGDRILMRDSKVEDGGVIDVSAQEWTEFVEVVKRGLIGPSLSQ
jgi:Domain of unknown function (DUF397)